MFKILIILLALIQPAAAEDEYDYGPDPVYVDPYDYDCGYDEQPEPELKLKTGDAL